MSATIHVDLANPQTGDELAGYLCSHGLAATVLRCDDHCELEVADAIDPAERLRATFEHALRAWLATAEIPLVPVAGASGSYVLRPPGD